MNEIELMYAALDEAREAGEAGEIPIGAVVAVGGEIVGRGHNLRETTQDPTAHAEIVALRDAAAKLDTWRLETATVIATLEPCPMCAGALVNARVARLVYGAADPKAGAVLTLYNLADDPRLNHRIEVVEGVLADECSGLLTEFFRNLRNA